MQGKIQIIRSNRRSLGLEINAKGEIIARAPYHLKERDIWNFVESKSQWIEKHLKQKECDQEILEIEGCFSKEEIDKLVKLAKVIIPEKVAYYARILSVSYGRISIRKQKSRWGSCSREGNLNFNCLLMMAPPEVMDYVVVLLFVGITAFDMYRMKQMAYEGGENEVNRIALFTGMQLYLDFINIFLRLIRIMGRRK